MYIDVFSHTKHAPFLLLIFWQLVSTSSLGHHQAIIQASEFKQIRKYHKLGDFHIFYSKNTLMICALCVKLRSTVRDPRTFNKNCITQALYCPTNALKL